MEVFEKKDSKVSISYDIVYTTSKINRTLLKKMISKILHITQDDEYLRSRKGLRGGLLIGGPQSPRALSPVNRRASLARPLVSLTSWAVVSHLACTHFKFTVNFICEFLKIAEVYL